MLKKLFRSVCIVAALCHGGGMAHSQGLRPALLKPFLEKHCYDCHSGDDAEGGLNLLKKSSDFADAEVRRSWVYLFDRVANGEMPPKEKYRPTLEAKAAFLSTLGGELTRADRANREVVLRRLNRNEYENTVRDLFGIHVDVQRLLPDDSSESSFDTIGADLSVSGEQMALYVTAADLVLDEVMGPTREPQRMSKKLRFEEFRTKERADRLTPEGGLLFGSRPVPLWTMSVPTPGTYRVRVRAKAVQSDKPVILRVDGGLTGQVASHEAGFFAVTPGNFNTYELIDRAVERSDNIMLSFLEGAPHWKVNVDEYKGPGLVVADVEMEGPLEPWPPPSRKRLLEEIDPAKGTLEDIRSILLRITAQAFRRPIETTAIEPYLGLAKQAFDQGKNFESALRRGLKGVMCAPEFLYLEESQTIDDFALASRLSYFLWSSLPDEGLLSAASSRTLRSPDVLWKQVERMLADPKSKRFVENFAGQWLRLRDIDFTVPNSRLYPEYNQLLRRSMLDETHGFFREILDRDLSVQNFIDSDFVMINQPLAEFYGIEGVTGLEIRRVDRPADSVRGGLLTQASILKVSADGTRTSPVLRGAWILKNFFGTPSPPPPPTVKAVEPDIRGATTIREQLEKHRNDHTCNRCHRKIDPPGFALESFDVIGAYRDWYRTSKGEWVKKTVHPYSRQGVLYRRGPVVDSTGVIPDGRKFAGIREYKQLLLADETAMARALTRLLLTYSLGRPMGFSDRPEIEQIVSRMKTKNYGFRSLIHEIVQCETFRSP